MTATSPYLNLTLEQQISALQLDQYVTQKAAQREKERRGHTQRYDTLAGEADRLSDLIADIKKEIARSKEPGPQSRYPWDEYA